MAVTKIKDIELQYMDRWFNNLVDNLNYDIQQIEVAVVALENVLNTIDTSPIQYLRDSLNDLVQNINNSFSDLDTRLSKLEQGVR